METNSFKARLNKAVIQGAKEEALNMNMCNVEKSCTLEKHSWVYREDVVCVLRDVCTGAWINVMMSLSKTSLCVLLVQQYHGSV